MGDRVDSPTPEKMRAMLAAVDPSDLEHGQVWLATNDEHVLEWNGDGRLVWYTPEHPGPRHIKGVDTDRTLELWQSLAKGDVAVVERLPWQESNGWVATPEWTKAMADYEAEEDRRVWNLLGNDDPGTRCREDGCVRAQIRHSHKCRVHHFEMLRGKPCPFDA